jgi:hypothetical protein
VNVKLLMNNYGHISTEDLLRATTPKDSNDTSLSDSTGNPWADMYRKDKYARDRVMKAARLLLPYLKDDDLVLDVGCFTQEARKYYPPWIKYLGVDQKKFHPETKVLDLNHGFEPIPCQHALCLETLEHLLDPLDTLESLLLSIQNEGFLVVSLPNENTLFHRIRALFGTSDAECFSGEGKHLHLPSLRQSRAFLSDKCTVVKELYYISPTACGSRQKWIGKVLSWIPPRFHQFLADRFPSLFARGFIFLLQKKACPESSTSSPSR